MKHGKRMVGLLLFCLLSGGGAQEVIGRERGTIVLTADTPWIIAPNQPESVARALEDLKRDWYKVFGHKPVIVSGSPAGWRKGPFVYFGHGGKDVEKLIKEPFKGPESYILRSQADTSGRSVIVATGADPRGSIYAAYTFAEHVLGVDPWYYWTDLEPEPQESITVAGDFDKSSGPPTFKWRGWFMNDEDLLSGFAQDPLRENLFSMEMCDKIYETLLRTRGNMIIPGTFIFPDERSQELASRRGLALHMHHVTCVGLNTHRWPQEVPYSYNEHPEILEKYWKQCIDAYNGREVVWTVGYRGQQDQPFWIYDKTLKTLKGMDIAGLNKVNGGFPFNVFSREQIQEIGDVITRAINKQVEFIQAAQPGAAMAMNLYGEGAQLVREGYVKIPKGVVKVWSDDGTGVIRDKSGVAAGDGLYYHTTYIGYGQNHLTEAINPGRIYSEIGAFVEAGATDLLINNCGNLRPVPLATDCVMQMAWDAKAYQGVSSKENMSRFLEAWCKRNYGAAVAKEVAKLYEEYFSIPYMQEHRRRAEHYLFSKVHELDREAAPLLQAGKPLTEKCLKLLEPKTVLKQFPSESTAYLEALNTKVQTMIERIPEKRRKFFVSHLVNHVQIHQHGLAMMAAYAKGMDAYVQGDKALAKQNMEDALKALDRIFASLRKAEYGRWGDWYRGEGLIGLEPTRDMLRTAIAVLGGEQAGPLRHDWRSYEHGICDYNKPFADHFPLFYRDGGASFGKSEKKGTE